MVQKLKGDSVLRVGIETQWRQEQLGQLQNGENQHFQFHLGCQNLLHPIMKRVLYTLLMIVSLVAIP